MGSPESELGRDADEREHSVTLTNCFYLQGTELTQTDWAGMMQSSPAQANSCDDCPMDTVGWWDALAFANTRSKAEGLPECYTLTDCDVLDSGHWICSEVDVNTDVGDPYGCTGYRLPTEAEWEYSYRAGTKTALYDGNVTQTSCGTLDANADAIAWYCGNTSNQTHPVAQKEPNAWGFYDMSGNVWELCEDIEAPYPTSDITNPIGPLRMSATSSIIMRGGAHNSGASAIRAASRGDVALGGLFNGSQGLRLARTWQKH
jgi:formylglycine-generating enzyme required for sulfatase activity